MRTLPKPVDDNGQPYVAAEVFDTCISKVGNADLKNRLQAIRQEVEEAALEYDNAASQAQLHQVQRADGIGAVTTDEMVGVYTKRMAKKGRPGRPIYDKIISAPKHSRCPLCNLGSVNTLDHHLPKSEYPVLAVTPNNLLPSCPRCQREKMEQFPNAAGEQTLHPYFDDFDSETWLYAEVVQGIPAAFRFFVQAPAGWDAITRDRLNSHLTTFELPTLYAENAGSELAGIRKCLARLLTTGGREVVRNQLQEWAESWENESKNSWRAAMYRAGAASDWFCDGGFQAE